MYLYPTPLKKKLLEFDYFHGFQGQLKIIG